MKEKIILTSKDLFLDLGFKTVTMDDIAQKMGISKKTIYSHFSNKTALVKACVAFIFSDITCEAEQIYGSQENPVLEFFLIRDYIKKTLAKQKPIARYQLEKFYPELFREIQIKQLTLMISCITENIERGIEKGWYRKEINPAFAARIYFANMTAIKDPVIFPHELFPIDGLFDQVIEQFLNGICTKKGIEILNNQFETK
ncbi:MAG: TetR/AcrR family transcriptional regulator [Flavobacteriaceae bacterium]